MAEHDLSIAPPETPQVGGATLEGEEPLDLWPDDGPDPAPADLGRDTFDTYDEPTVLVAATEDQVRTVLEAMGSIGNLAADPDVPEQWLFLDGELDQLVPPLTRIVNRHQVLARIVAGSDPLLAGFMLAKYLGRNVSDGQQARRNREGDTTDGNLDAEARGAGPGSDRPRDPGAHDWDGESWSAGVPPDEVVGLGAFQG